MAKYNVSEKEAKKHGIERVLIGDSKKSSSSSSSDKAAYSSDAKKYLEGVGATTDFKDWLEKQNYGDTLTSGEAKTFYKKWIDASKTNTPTKENLAVYNLPEAAFSPRPQLIPGTPEYQAAMDKLSTAYFDVIQQQLNASTEQEKVAADYNWQTLKKTIEQNLNVGLSDDAFQAWNQIQTIKNQYGQQNISGSGLQNEAIDSYLNTVRRADEKVRDAAQTKEDSAMQDYYMKFATPEQIKALVESDPEKAKGWGLMPSDEIRTSLSPAALRAKYPNMSDEDIQKNISTVLDANGNYRSSLYQKYMTGSNVGANLGNVDTANIVYDQYGSPISMPVKPSDTGYLDIQGAKQQYLNLNTTLASQAADAAARISLGQTKPTAGQSEAGGSDTTLFNKIDPTSTNITQTDTLDPVTLKKPIVVPGSMLSSAS